MSESNEHEHEHEHDDRHTLSDDEARKYFVEKYPDEFARWDAFMTAVKAAAAEVWDGVPDPALVVGAQFGSLPMPLITSTLHSPCAEMSFLDAMHDLAEAQHDAYHGIDPKTGLPGPMTDVKTFEEVKDGLPDDVRERIEAMIEAGVVRAEDVVLMSQPNTEDVDALPETDEVTYPTLDFPDDEEV
jgi:hypothetical protein